MEAQSAAKKRPICGRCNRPTPRACICEALPEKAIELRKCRVLVLQHPHEQRRKNRSLPLIQLCLSENSLTTAVGRRFGDRVDDSAMELLQQKDVILIYPSPDAISLSAGLQRIQESRQTRQSQDTKPNGGTQKEAEKVSEKITLILLDATWRHAREMEQKNVSAKQYPDHMIRVRFCPEPSESESKDEHPDGFLPLRFNIRTPPSERHLSTAECIAWAVSTIEEDPTLYSTLMKPLDLMVQKWRSFLKDNRGPVQSFTSGDGEPEEGGGRQRKKARCT